jgi:serine/threonine-protein kinase
MLNERGALDPSSTMRLAVQIGEALETLHHNGIVHGALRPESVLIVKDEDGTDAVKLRGLELASARWTAAGIRLRDDALLPYLAPEQIEHAETSETADIHALGLLVQELLTAARPRGTGSRLRPAGELPMMIGRIVAKALESRPERRYANVSLMVNDLWSAESEPPKSDSPSVTHVLNERRAAARRRARSDIGMGIALVVGLVLVGVTAWVVRSDRLTGNARTESAEPSIAASPVGTPVPPPPMNAVSVQPLRPPTPPTITEDTGAVVAKPDATGREPTAALPARPVAKTSPPAAARPASVDERGSDADGSAIIDWLLKARRTGH